MKLNRFFWLLIGVITVAYVAILSYVRLDNNHQLQNNVYQQWHSHYVVELPHQQIIVNSKAGNGRTMVALSEGQGYGMLLTLMAAEHGWANRTEFQKYVNYYLANRDVHHGQKTALMAWRQFYNSNGKLIKSNHNSATDGDLLIAQALFRADRRWPGHHYGQLGKEILTAVLRDEYNPQTKVLTVGNWVTKKSHDWNLLRTSDVMPEAFDEFYRATGNHQWLEIKQVMLKRLNQLSHQNKTGLVPDFAYITGNSAVPAQPNTVEGPNDGNYAGNACRVPMLLAHSHDSLARDTEKRLLKFFEKQSRVTAGYRLNGQALNHYQSNSISAPVFAAVSANRNAGYDSLFVRERAIIERPLPTNSYYAATLTALVVLDQ
ncbi:beta-glucanase [Lactobacillus alvi]|uniref:Beta-glucanase n=1 Tax=Limosilactobacillus alvi TaxID=990412 RepID=A0ABS2EMF9_9LACO|nr:glycosyl hydrolase family 8 [Limosilactobacillus alvi]MBM6753541.1 beta-glucanase [Limosilactobacillus alvi]